MKEQEPAGVGRGLGGGKSLRAPTQHKAVSYVLSIHVLNLFKNYFCKVKNPAVRGGIFLFFKVLVLLLCKYK